MRAIVMLTGLLDDIPIRSLDTEDDAVAYAKLLKGLPNEQLIKLANEVGHRDIGEIIGVDVIAFDDNGKPYSHVVAWYYDNDGRACSDGNQKERTMNAIKLTSADGKLITWACSKCLRVSRSKEHAEKCCRCSECGEPLRDKGDLNTIHDSCSRKKQEEQMEKWLETAEEVPYEGGFVWCEGWGYRDGYFDDMDCLLDRLEDEPQEVWPEFVFACECYDTKMDIDCILEDLCRDGYEDMEDRLTVPKELTDAIAKFNADNKVALQSWDWTTKRKYRVPRKEER